MRRAENYCIQETIKSFFNHGLRPNIFYLRTHNGLEIDLLVEKDTGLYPMQMHHYLPKATQLLEKIEKYKLGEEVFLN